MPRAAPVAGQGRQVIIERDGDGPGQVVVADGQDDAQDKGGKRVIVRKIRAMTVRASTSSAWAARAWAWSSATSKPPT